MEDIFSQDTSLFGNDSGLHSSYANPLVQPSSGSLAELKFPRSSRSAVGMTIPEDEYLVGDWDGDGRDNIAVRRGNKILMDTNFDGIHNILQTYGDGNREDEYLVGDWDGDGRDNIAVRRGNQILMDTNFDGRHDILLAYGTGNNEDQYLVGDWDGDGRDNIAVRRGGQILMDTNFGGVHDILQTYGGGNNEDEYLVGDWDGDGRDNIAVRRGGQVWMDFNFDGWADLVQTYGLGNGEDEYLVGNWNGDHRDNIAVRRGSQILMDVNFDSTHDLLQTYGLATADSGIRFGSDGRLGSAFSLSNISIFDSSNDVDGDGLNDLWENIAVQSLNPALQHHQDENLFDRPQDKVATFTRVTPATTSTGEQYILFLNTIAYSNDYGDPILGLRDHKGDTEQFQVAWKVTDSTTIELDRLRTTGHNGTGAPFIPVPPVFGWEGHTTETVGRQDIELTSSGQVKVYIEEDKHGTWASKRRCEDGPYPCGTEPEYLIRPTAYNVGEPPEVGTPLIDRLGNTSEFPGESVWSDAGIGAFVNRQGDRNFLSSKTAYLGRWLENDVKNQVLNDMGFQPLSFGNVSVTINRVRGDFDGWLNDSDFYSKVLIDGHNWRSSQKDGSNDYRPHDWHFQQSVSSHQVPIRIRLFDADPDYDDRIDIDPQKNDKEIDLIYNLLTGEVTGDVIGQKGQQLYSRGRGDSDQGEIWFTINHS